MNEIEKQIDIEYDSETELFKATIKGVFFNLSTKEIMCLSFLIDAVIMNSDPEFEKKMREEK